MSSGIISREPFIPHLFEELDPSDQMMIEESQYAEYLDWFNNCSDAQFERIMYWSDGLRIAGIISRLKTIDPTHPTPVIIYNRGGAGESGKINVRTLCKRIYPLVLAGYTVIASQYRGNDGSEGSDEIGGADIDDIIALLPVIESLSYVDPNNIFMIGFSRGAIDTYRVLQKNTLPIKACAVMSGLSDVFSFEQLRPDLTPLLEHFIPDYLAHKVAELTKRSAIHWVKDIGVPLLILHGEVDDMVDVATSKRLAEELALQHKEHKLVICPNADHSLDGCEELVFREIESWFQKYRHKE